MIHPDRGNLGARIRKGGVVVHDSESADGTAAALIVLLATPGDRPTATGVYGSSYHAIALEDGTYAQVAGPEWTTFSAPPLNSTWWHICMPGRAAQTRTEWLDTPSRNYIHAVARFIVDKSKTDGFPCVQVGPVAMRAATPDGFNVGYCGHVDVTAAWHQTDHTDPGGYFPWDVLAGDIAALLHPTPPPTPPLEDDMPLPVLAYWKGKPGYIVTDMVTYWRFLSSVDEAKSLVLVGRAMWGNQAAKTFGELDQSFYPNVPQI